MMEVMHSSESSALTRATRRYILQYDTLHNHILLRYFEMEIENGFLCKRWLVINEGFVYKNNKI
jgi:hypothetical protein